MRQCSANAIFALTDETRACRFSSPKFFRHEHSELRVLRRETRVLYMRLAFEVHDLENFKTCFCSFEVSRRECGELRVLKALYALLKS